MATKEQTMEQLSITGTMKQVCELLESIATSGPPADLASAVGMFARAEKAARKAKNAMTASIVTQAAQQALKL